MRDKSGDRGLIWWKISQLRDTTASLRSPDLFHNINYSDNSARTPNIISFQLHRFQYSGFFEGSRISLTVEMAALTSQQPI